MSNHHPLIGQPVRVQEHTHADYGIVPAVEYAIVSEWGNGGGRVLYPDGVERPVGSSWVTFVQPDAAARALARAGESLLCQRDLSPKGEVQVSDAESLRRKVAPTLAELQEDCRRTGSDPASLVALVKMFRCRNGSRLEDAYRYVKRLLAAGGFDAR